MVFALKNGGFESLTADSAGELQSGEVGMMLNGSSVVREQGYAVEALKSVIEYGFQELKLKVIRLGTLQSNGSMMGSMRKHLVMSTVT